MTPAGYCGNCGSPLSSGERYCGECGQPVPEISEQPSTPAAPPPIAQTRRSRSSIARWGCIGLVILFVGGLGVTAYSILRVLNANGGIPPIVITTPQLPTLVNPTTTPGPSYTTGISDYWFDHNVESDGENYLVIHLSFEAAATDADELWVTAYFWYPDGTAIPAAGSAMNVDGQTAVRDSALVEFAPVTYWDDYQLWIPYEVFFEGADYYATLEIEDSVSGQLFDWVEAESFDVFQ